MPGDVNDVDRRLASARGQEWFACKRVHCLPSFAPSDIQAGYAYPPVIGDAQDTEVEQRMVERAEGQRVRYVVGALLAVPAHVGRFDRDWITPKGAVESAHRTLVGVGTQDLFGKSAAPGPQPNGPGDSLGSDEVQSGHVKIDSSADQVGQDWREVQVKEEPGGPHQGGRVG